MAFFDTIRQLAQTYPFFFVLIAVMGADIVTGIFLGFINKTLSSSVSFRGICSKVSILIFIGICLLIQSFIPPIPAPHTNPVTYVEFPLYQIAAIFYLSSECLSVMENMAAIGVPLPQSIVDALIQVRSGKKCFPG